VFVRFLTPIQSERFETIFGIGVLTHPDYAALVAPLSGKPQRGEKTFPFSKPSLRSREGGRAKQRPGESTMRLLRKVFVRFLTPIQSETT
jgi:hypothetical protein